MARFRVLVADDDRVMGKVIAKTLCDLADIEIVRAYDGDETMSLLSQAPFDLLLLDWHMPGRSGVEILKALRHARSSVPVIMITAAADRASVVEALKNGVNAYVVKPFDRNYLWRKVAEIWRRNQAPGVTDPSTERQSPNADATMAVAERTNPGTDHE